MWAGNNIEALEQFKLDNQSFSIHLNEEEPRLGKRAEQFLLFQLAKLGFPVLASNMQIQKNSNTIGEIDAIIVENDLPLHLEVCYKFYLYDPHIKGSEIDKWIGPNRRDSFKQKLDKLKNKQFPLLFNPAAIEQLEKAKIPHREIQQKVLFKAQLFLPADHMFVNTIPIDVSSVVGYYYTLEQMNHFSDCKFYIPMKPDWLMEVQTQIDWLNFDAFRLKVLNFLNKKNAPLCWLKKPSGKLDKLIVIWW